MSQNQFRLGRAIVLLALPALLLLSGCGALDALGLSRPTASLAGVSLKDIGVESATLLFDVKVNNPYSVPLPLVNADYELASRAAQFLSGKADLQGTVPARGSKVVSLPAKIDYRGLLGALEGVRPGQVLPYTADLALSVDAPAVGALRLPMKKEGKIPVPAAPDVSVEEVRWDTPTLERAGGLVRLRLVNQNQFPVDLSKINYALSLAGVEVAQSSLAKPASFKPDGGAGTIDIPISLAPRKLGSAAWSMLSGKGAGYRLGGSLDVSTPFGPMSLPIDKVGRTVFRR